MRSRKQFSFDLVLAMTLFCAFTVVALLLAGIGSRVYGAAKDGFETDYQLRTALSYVSGKLRYEGAARVEQRALGAGEALVLTEQSGEDAYETWIYFADGALYEQYVPAGTDIRPQAGTALFALDDFRFTLDEGEKALTLVAQTGGKDRTQTLCVNRFAEVDE